MTNSVSHNNFLSEDLPKLLDLDHKAGQLFCSAHTNLGLCSSLNSSIHEIELEHGLSHMMDGFIVEIDYESKQVNAWTPFYGFIQQANWTLFWLLPIGSRLL